jgi:hypothetical protein
VTVLLSVTDEFAICLAQCGDDVAEGEIESDMSIGKLPAAMAV